MSITIELEPETEARLRERAKRKGQNVDRLAADTLKRLVANDENEETPYSAAAALAALINLSPEEKEAMHNEAERQIIPGRPLPPGKTLEDMVWGKWPGDETDEEINAALEELS